jgi:Bardet-Biedl syndrome 4 protein
MATTVPKTSNAAPLISQGIRERRNWQIHLLYIRQRFRDCLKMIDDQLKESNGHCEYPLYVKGS